MSPQKDAFGSPSEMDKGISPETASADAAGNPIWRAMFDCMSDSILLLDADLNLFNANEAAGELLGKPVTALVGKSPVELFDDPARAIIVDLLARLKTTRAHQEQEIPLPDRDMWLLLAGDVIQDGEGNLGGAVLKMYNITARRKMEEELRESEQRYRAIFEQAAEPVMLIDAESGAIVEFNEMAYLQLGYTREVFSRLTMPTLETAASADEGERAKQRLLVEGMACNDTRYRASNGALIDVRVSSRTITLHGRRFIQSIWRDVTEQKRAEESMHALSLVDDLTGLYNRRGFQTLAEQQFKIAARMRKKMFLLFVDVDGMKRVNDTKGHREGDQLLVEAASAIRQAFRNSDIAARIGGDEFVVLVLEAERLWPEMLRGRLEQKVKAKNADGRDPALSISVGIVPFDPEEPTSLDGLLHQADQAMYNEKRRKRESR